ncbi:hypothetical protein T265_11590 [Opisthorchis viverrini]|uniref:Uncharacterized protein n=1 Tax=Opisthorchis viverrini TaxID=6198 RepID=A0A074Z909_OPIVI|nr:hypothetical protein T265_11590 [Opisthorchis viverrini]KER19710.1 hypothetical protein T265_11590 [Opisthorchis viverrini]
MPPDESTRAEIPPGSPSLDKGSGDADVGFEPRTFREGTPTPTTFQGVWFRRPEDDDSNHERPEMRLGLKPPKK